MGKRVRYKGEVLTLTRFWADGSPCLWISNPGQRGMPKMRFVGGYPNEYCIFLRDLAAAEMADITAADGSPIGLAVEIKALRQENS